ncbi:conjugal transfer protein [Nocardiopsis changdeensis]|uniref:Conjugal transfer protein n=1 Tax=Nocardiopsis changdeensis TaxID=2831969 RepID=A0ABX8BIC4_9ACTN|nr:MULTISPECIES: conjugal transfer protein [Nocardiopsis]QUX21975.1 conjugal transfer protein [Nocardiopsis changdeensis]QYX37912.1 conjugal transfer protein [Nocardiopsis sp. MT53]
MANAPRRGAAVRERHDDADHEAPPPRRRPRPGAGGRWWVGVGRAVLWAFLIVVIFNGIWFPLRGGLALPAPDPEPEQAQAPAFPETSAADFALRFADAYLTTDDIEARRTALAAFVPEGEAEGLDVPAGSLAGENLAVTAVDVKDDNNALVVVRADVNGEPVSLEVPVYSDGDSLVVSGRPALLAAPARASLPEQAAFDTDPAAAEQLEEVLTGFFGAYAQEPGHLERYVEPGVTIAPLPANTLEFSELSDITVPSRSESGDDDVREVAVTVHWTAPAPEGEAAGTLRQSYLVTVVDSGNEWHVRDIQGAPHSFGE